MRTNRVVVGLVALGVVVTFATLGRKSVWLDEAVSVRSAERTMAKIWIPPRNSQPPGYSLPLHGMWLDKAASVRSAGRPVAEVWIEPRDPHPPGYYLLLHAWPWRDGGEASVRLLSALAGALSIALAFMVAGRMWDRRTAWIAAVLLAWAPLHVWYAQEARMYAFVEFAGLLMALGLALESSAGLAVFALGLAIGCYFDYTAVLVWAAVSAVWLGWWAATHGRVSQVARWLLASIVGGILAWPMRTGLFEVLGPSLGSTVFGERLTALIGSRPSPAFAMIALAGAIGAMAAITCVIIRRRDHAVTAWTVVAIFAAVTLAAVAPRLFTLKKIIAPSWPIATLAVAGLAVRLTGRARLAIGLIVGLSVLATSWMLFGVPKDDWRGVVSHLNRTARAGADVVWLDPSWDVVAYDFYKPIVPPVSGGPLSLGDAAKGQGMLWLIVQRRPGSARPASPSEAWLDAHLTLEQQATFPRLELKGYRRRPG